MGHALDGIPPKIRLITFALQRGLIIGVCSVNQVLGMNL